MRKILSLVLIVLLVPLATALGEIKQLDIEKGDTITVDFKVKEGVQLNLLGKRNIININKIHKDGVDLDIFVDVDGEQVINYLTVNKKQSVKLDVDRDGRGEMYIDLNKFFNYDDPDGKRSDGVSLDFFYPTEEDFGSNSVTGNVVKNSEVSYNSKAFIRFVIFIVALFAVLIALTMFLKRKNNVKKTE